MVKKLFLMLVVALFCSSFMSFGQNIDKTVTLVVSGEGLTKEDATKNALRSAIEQAFGTFVSANTEVVNDELIKDEIVSVTSGNIQSYKELGFTELESGSKFISIEAVVAIEKLQTYAQNKGMSTELAGNLLAMNVRIEKLNKENERKAIENLFMKLIEIAKCTPLFDYTITSEVVYNEFRDKYFAQGNVKIKYNQNYINMVDIYDATLKSLAALNTQGKKITFDYFTFPVKEETKSPYSDDVTIKYLPGKYELRNSYHWDSDYYIRFFHTCLFAQMMNFKIKDNIGNESKWFLARKGYDEDYFVDGTNVKTRVFVFHPQGYERSYVNTPEEYVAYFSNTFNINKLELKCSYLFKFGEQNYINQGKAYNEEFTIYWDNVYNEEEINKLTKIEVIPYDYKLFSKMTLEDFISFYKAYNKI